MKKFIYIILAFVSVVVAGGCKKYLDVNKDPNNPLDVSMDLILPPVETEISTIVAGGSLSANNQTGIAEVTSFFMREISLNQTQPQIDGYKLRQDDVDPLWFYMYSGIMQNIHIMNNKAEASGNHSYGVISKVLMAYTLGVTTDMWGDVPFNEAFDGNFKPAYQSQEDIYKTLDVLLDSAILEKGLEPGNVVPGADDFIYEGDMDKWAKFAYALKARNAIHLTNAPGHDAVTQSNLALTVLENAFASAEDEAKFAKYSDAPATENPWFKNIAEDQGGVVLESNFLDSLVNRNDPRLPIIATKPNGVYLGRVNTTDPVPDFTVFSVINEFYAGVSSPQSIVNYPEMLFIKAEATYRVSGAAAAMPVYQQAIKSDMQKLGLDVNSPEVIAYLASRGSLTEQNALQRIMEEKAIANFLSIENYNDWRRTGFPVLPPVPQPFVPYVPLRFPYPLAEITSNSQPQHSITNAEPVWWDGD